MMLGFDTTISDIFGREIFTTKTVIENLSPSMKRRMKGIIDIADVSDEYEPYPLYQGGKEIGTIGRYRRKKLYFQEKRTGVPDYFFHYCRRRSIIPVISFRDIHVTTA